MDWMGE